MSFEPVAVGVTGDLIRKSGLANVLLILQSKKHSEIKWIRNEKIVPQSSIFKVKRSLG